MKTPWVSCGNVTTSADFANASAAVGDDGSRSGPPSIAAAWPRTKRLARSMNDSAFLKTLPFCFLHLLRRGDGGQEVGDGAEVELFVCQQDAKAFYRQFERGAQ
jgi:hypothetical protein